MCGLLSLSFSGVGVCTDNHNRGGNDGYGGCYHVSAESLQTLCAFLHQSAQPRTEERGKPIIGKEALPPSNSFLLPHSVHIVYGVSVDCQLNQVLDGMW